MILDGSGLTVKALTTPELNRAGDGLKLALCVPAQLRASWSRCYRDARPEHKPSNHANVDPGGDDENEGGTIRDRE